MIDVGEFQPLESYQDRGPQADYATQAGASRIESPAPAWQHEIWQRRFAVLARRLQRDSLLRLIDEICNWRADVTPIEQMPICELTDLGGLSPITVDRLDALGCNTIADVERLLRTVRPIDLKEFGVTSGTRARINAAIAQVRERVRMSQLLDFGDESEIELEVYQDGLPERAFQ